MTHVKSSYFKALICYAIFFMACSSTSHDGTSHYEIGFLKNSTEQFTFKESIKYIPLETNSDCLIGAVYKIIISSGNIFVHTENMLYQFDTSGNFIRKIGAEGRGPMEYGYILDVSVDEASGKIFICDNPGKKINIYNLSGEYIGKKDRHGLWKRFEVFVDRLFIIPLNYSGNETCMLKVVDEVDSTICFNNYVRYKQQDIFLINDVKNFQKISNELIFHQQFNDTIYRYDPENKTLSIRYSFGFGNLRLPYDLLGNLSRWNNESSNYAYLYDVCENINYVFATISYRGENERYVINKKTGKSYFPDKDQDLIWPLWSTEKGVLVSYIQANNVLKHKNDILDPELKKIASEIREEDNPIIVLIE